MKKRILFYNIALDTYMQETCLFIYLSHCTYKNY